MMNRNGRIVVSGQIADYNLAPESVHGITNTRHFITHRVRMEGLVVFDDLADFPAAQTQMADWILAGRMRYREDFIDGLEAIPEGFMGLFKGENFGRRIARLGLEPKR